MRATTKINRLMVAKRLFLLNENGLTDIELAAQIGVDRITAFRYRKELNAKEVGEGRYTLEPTQEDIDLALAVLQRANKGRRSD